MKKNQGKKSEIETNVITEKHTYSHKQFLKQLDEFLKTNSSIIGNPNWKKITINHSKFKDESEYRNYLENNNTDSDGIFNDITKAGIYAYYYNKKCLYIGKAAKSTGILSRAKCHYRAADENNTDKPSINKKHRLLFNTYLKKDLKFYYINLDDELSPKISEHLRTTIEGMLQLQHEPIFDSEK